MTVPDIPKTTFPDAPNDAVRVLICTEKDIISTPLNLALRGDAKVKIAGTAKDGISAVTFVRKNEVDIVILDIGVGERMVLTTLSRLQKADEGVRILLVGTTSFANVRTSMKALVEGAVEFIPVPANHAAQRSQSGFRSELLGNIRALGVRGKAKSSAIRKVSLQPAPKPVELAPPGKGKPKILLIGSSTGGPKALMDVLKKMSGRTNFPILITQHMPRTFTAALAKNLERQTGIPAGEGIDGEVVQQGRIYIAPGGLHMRVHESGGVVKIKLDDGVPVNFCKPAVDPLFESAASVYGANLLALILTGMGKDGCDGAIKIKAAGGTVIAQDEATSVVWGMPGAAARAGVCSQILPLDKIADTVLKSFNRY